MIYSPSAFFSVRFISDADAWIRTMRTNGKSREWRK